MVVLSLNGAADDIWTTSSGATDSALSSLTATHHLGASATGTVVPADQVSELNGVFTTRYVTADGAVSTDLTHFPDGVVRAVTASEPGREQLPIVLRPTDVVTFSDGTIVVPGTSAAANASWLAVDRGAIRILVNWGVSRSVTFDATTRTFFADRSRLHQVLTIPHEGTSTVEITSIDLATTDADLRVVAHAATWVDGGVVSGAIHATNLEAEPVNIKIAGLGGRHEWAEVASGASVRLVQEQRTRRTVTLIAFSAATGRRSVQHITLGESA